MKKFRRFTALALSALLALSLFGCGSETAGTDPGGASGDPGSGGTAEVDDRTYHIATGALGAYNYTLYAGVSDLIDKEYPDKYTISLDAATGSTEMARLVTMGDADRTCTSVAPAALSMRTICRLVVPRTMESSTITSRFPRTTSGRALSLSRTPICLSSCVGWMKVRAT